MRYLLTLLIIVLLTNMSLVDAAGTMQVKDGKPVTYGNRALKYKLDKGNLGILSNVEAASLFSEAFNTWKSVASASVKFENHGFLDQDIDSSNFETIYFPNKLHGYSPVIYDNDGSIVNALFGVGSDDQVLGAAGIVTDYEIYPDEIAESDLLINGKLFTDINTLKGTVTHEIGHAIGIDYTQTNLESITTFDPDGKYAEASALMFPISVSDNFHLHRDDISSVSLLYPNNSELLKYGSIEGKVLNVDRTSPIYSANVIAIKKGDYLNEQVSCVSDYLADGTGSFKLVGLTSGEYNLFIEPIFRLFYGGSSVGPHAKASWDKAFKYKIPSGFYTGKDQPITTNVTKARAATFYVGSSEVVDAGNIVAELDTNYYYQDPSSCKHCSSTGQCLPGTYFSSLTSSCQCIYSCNTQSDCHKRLTCRNSCCVFIRSY